MKQIKLFFISCILLFSLTSCVTDAFAYNDGVYTTDYYTVITHGTPIYIDNVIRYYIYNNMYYYPYTWNGRRYFYTHNSIQPRSYRYIPHGNHRPYMHLGDNYTRQHHSGHYGNQREHNIRNHGNSNQHIRPRFDSSTRVHGNQHNNSHSRGNFQHRR